MTADQQIQKIESDRLEREKELLLLFLLLSDTAKSYAMAAVRLGHDPVSAVRSVFLGNPDLDLRGGVNGTAVAMQEAYKGANDTASDIADAEPKIVTPPRYDDVARDAINRMIQPLTKRIRGAQEDSKAKGRGAKKTANAVGQAFADGYSRANPEVMNAVSVTFINNAYQPGLYRGFKNANVKGLGFDAVLDSVTTTICRVRNGVQLPIDNPWWQSNSPSLHYFCRSSIRALFGDFSVTENPPTQPQPQAGFGTMRMSFATT